MDLASSRNTWRFSSGCKWEEGGVRLNMTSAAALARVSGTYAVTWEKCLVGVVRVLRSAASGRRRAGFRARQGGGVVELEARGHRQLQRRTAPACHAEYRLPDSAPPPIALHCIAAAGNSHHRIHLAASPHRRQPRRRPLPFAAEFRAGTVSISSPPCNAHARSKKPIHVLPATTPCSAITT
jgi:hypothetical protein